MPVISAAKNMSIKTTKSASDDTETMPIILKTDDLEADMETVTKIGRI